MIFTKHKDVSINKMKRIANMPTSRILLEISTFNNLIDNDIKYKTSIKVHIVNGLFIYSLSFREPNNHKVCLRRKFTSEKALESYTSTKHSKQRVYLDEIIAQDFLMQSKIKLTIAYASLF